MLSQQRPKFITECIIRNEIKDWFKQHINKEYGPDINIRYLSNDTHFNVQTYIKISGSETEIKDVAEFIRQTIDVLKYKMPWLNESTYYIQSDSEKGQIKKRLKTMYKADSDFNYELGDYDIVGMPLNLFSFRPDLDATKKLLIDETFKSLGNSTPIFIAYYQTSGTRNQSSFRIAANILARFHGTFLYFLNLQDIISLEMANTHLESDYDADLQHDIQKHLRYRFSFLYQTAEVDYMNLQDFCHRNVLRYFIHKYHKHLNRIDIPNILTADEIQLLSSTYTNITINYQKIIHIDFKSATNDFCLVYHFDPKRAYFLNYDSKYASENYTIHFNANDSLDHLSCDKQFTYFALRSQNNVTPQKSNSIINWVAKHFEAGRRGSQLILNEFDLNCVSKQNLGSLLDMVGRGTLVFDNIYFNIQTLIAILSLEQREQSRLKFIKCQITCENVEVISNEFRVCEITFNNMDTELNVLLVNSSHLVGTLMEKMPNDIKNINKISFSHSDFDVTTLLRLLARLPCTRSVTFLSCTVARCHPVVSREYFIIQEKVLFNSMVFGMQTLFLIFDSSDIQNRLIFQNCHIRFENVSKLTLKPVNIEFHNTIFDLLALLTILETLNKKSKILIHNSNILPSNETVYTPKSVIRLGLIQFNKCRFETHTLVNVLGAMSKTSCVHFERCELLHSSSVCPSPLTNLSKIIFWDMKLNSYDVFGIWEILNENSSIFFRRCEIEIPADSEINLKKKLNIQLAEMIVTTEFARSFLQTESMVKFDNCDLLFMSDEFLYISIESNVAFQNMTFDLSSAHMKSLANFAYRSKIQFWNCHFESTHFLIPKIMIKSYSISFYQTSFDLDTLVTLLDQVSNKTRIYMNACDMRPKPQVFSIRRLTIPSMHFAHMNLEVEMILCIVKNFPNGGLSILQFENCKISCSNINAVPDAKLTPTILYFRDIKLDVKIFQILVQKCSKRVTVSVENCDIISPGDHLLTNVPVEIQCISFRRINYSIGHLHILKYLIGHFSVEYHDQLSNKEIIEICVNTPVHGDRLQLMSGNRSKLVCFELFAEFLRPLALQIGVDSEAEYDPPIHLIPQIKSLAGNWLYDWNALKIKFIPTNDASVKIEFLKNGKPIDLFYEVNGLADDSEECAVDYH